MHIWLGCGFSSKEPVMCFYISTDHFYRGPTAFLNDNNCRFSYKNIQKHSESKFNKGTVISTHHGHHFNGNFGLLITSWNCSFLQGGMIAQQTSLMGTQLIHTGSKVYLHLHIYLANCPIASCSSIRQFCTSTSIILSHYYGIKTLGIYSLTCSQQLQKADVTEKGALSPLHTCSLHQISDRQTATYFPW